LAIGADPVVHRAYLLPAPLIDCVPGRRRLIEVTRWTAFIPAFIFMCMATMISELYDALKAAGAPEDKARKAAEVVAGHENRFVRVEADLTLVKWMLAFNLAMTIVILTLLLRH
jgi:hypothetical protein